MRGDNDIIIKPYSHGDLCRLYNVTWHVMHIWLKPFEHLIGPKVGRYYTIKQVAIIFANLGWPEGKAAA
jgi:hypothetical protein